MFRAAKFCSRNTFLYMLEHVERASFGCVILHPQQAGTILQGRAHARIIVLSLASESSFFIVCVKFGALFEFKTKSKQ